ncbi:transglutaminaseTgpA domain-containing protein [Antribacter gilvus]|uniref:transglutaminase family protein n=1 Tax=Antribacter gilvus TaxID=2304675 RepID=UPI000F793EBF|nr:transglutaminase domain-containing protein [Antribacter gilvus]
MIPAYRGPFVRTIVTGALVTVAVLVSMLTLGAVIEPGAWTVAGAQGVLLVALTTNVVRVLMIRADITRAAQASEAGGAAAGKSRGASSGRGTPGQASGAIAFWSTVAGSAVGLWFLLARFGAPTQQAELFVGAESFERLGQRLRSAGEIMRDEVAPVDDSLAIGVAAVGGTLLVLLVADSLAEARMPALAALPLLLLWAPALTLMGDVPSWVFVVVVSVALLLLTVDPAGAMPGRRSEPRDPAVRHAQRRRAGITAVSSLLVAVLAHGVGSGLNALPAFARGFSQLIATEARTVQLSDELDLREPLGARSNEVVLTYRTSDEANVGPLRLFTLTAFDGARSQRAVLDGGGRDFDDGDVLWPGGFSAGEGSRDVTMTIRGLSSPELPIPVDPRSVGIEGNSWEYYNTRDEVRGDRDTRTGDVYTMSVFDRALSPEGLRGAVGPDPGSSGYTDVPTTEHSAEIAALAEEIAGSAPTRYDQAMALQSYLRDGGRFIYTPDTTYDDSDDPVWDFLEQREGYCVQFASTMMVMARSLGIPTRLGVGYLPGERSANGTWSVTGQASHAWPEIYFADAGWVRFEPTPAVQTGAPPRYADPALVAPAPLQPEEPQEVPSAEPTASQAAPSATASASAGAGSGSGGGAAENSMPFWVWLTTGIGGLLLITGVVVWLLRRRTEVEVLDPERAWSRVLAVLAERDVVLPPSTTLRRAPEAIDAQVRARTGEPLAADVADQLVALADAAESERYARDYVPPSAEQLEALTGELTAALTGALSGKT